MSTAQQVNEAARLGAQAARTFLSEHRELLSSFDWPSIERALGSWLQLHARTEIEQAAPSVDLYLRLQRVGFLTLLDKGVIAPAPGTEITKLGQADLDAMRRATGIGVENLPAPERVLTPEQQFEQEVINAWKTLPSDQFRARVNGDRHFREVWKRLGETDAIQSRVRPAVADLEQIVRDDWRNLPTREIKRKCADDPLYKECVDRLAEANAL